MATRRSYSTAAAPTTLTVGIDNAVTSVTVQDGSTYVDGTSGPSVLTIDRGKSNEERILYTSRVGNTFSGLTRGYNGTAAQSHTAGAIVEHTSTQQDFDEANAHVTDATRNDHTQYARVAAANNFTAAQTFSSTATFPGGILGGIAATGADHYFGANAAGGAGTRVHLGSLGDANNAYVVSEGSGADVGLIFRTKGAGNMYLQLNGVTQWYLDTAGNLISTGTSGAGPTFTGNGVLALHNAAANPFTTPTNGGVLYVTAGALHYRGPSGTDTVVAAA